MTISAAFAASNPVSYIHSLCEALPHFFRDGGTPEEVEDATAGVLHSLEAIGAPRGSWFHVSLYPKPWGWSATYEEDAGIKFGIQPLSAGASRDEYRQVRPAFDNDQDLGFLVVPGRSGGWKIWHPAEGSAPEPPDGRMSFGLLIVPRNGGLTTAVFFEEKLNEDLKHPFYSVAVASSSISSGHRSRIVDVLRTLCMPRDEGGAS